MKRIESIIFDWGGVLIDDPEPGLMQYCADALAAPNEDYIKAHRKFTADFQKGLIMEDTFWARICGELSVPKPEAFSLWAKAFEAVYSPRVDMFSLARSLSKNGYKIALLSNAEPPAMQYFYQQRYDMFDTLVFSCEEKTRKPERKIYELALERLGSQPTQSIFVDDKPEYINGAQEVGINTVLFQSMDQVRHELARLGVKLD